MCGMEIKNLKSNILFWENCMLRYLVFNYKRFVFLEGRLCYFKVDVICMCWLEFMINVKIM